MVTLSSDVTGAVSSNLNLQAQGPSTYTPKFISEVQMKPFMGGAFKEANRVSFVVDSGAVAAYKLQYGLEATQDALMAELKKIMVG